jgi:hypothetical protein
MAVDPVPTTPTRLPVKSTPSAGQRPVWYHSPSKLSMLLKSGTRGVERLPAAMMQKGALTTSPRAVVRVQRLAAGSWTAETIRVSSCTSRRRSKRSATRLMYSRMTGCVA